jgi:ethanolamine utilization microcompartment shell protein EutS
MEKPAFSGAAKGTGDVASVEQALEATTTPDIARTR